MSETKRKIAFVTGASRGIGEGIARRLAEHGYRVVCAARSADTVDTIAREIGGMALALDVTDSAAIESALARVEAEWGPVDVLVNNAGIAESASLDRTTDDIWDRTIAVNLTACFQLTRRVVPHMVARKAGRVVFVASNAGLTGYAYTSAYCASKHGVIGFMRALAAEYARTGVTFNAVCPGFVETDMARAAIAKIEASTDRDAAGARKALERMNPQNRLIQIDEVVDAVLYLVGEGARGINGQTLTIDGGQVMS